MDIPSTRGVGSTHSNGPDGEHIILTVGSREQPTRVAVAALADDLHVWSVEGKQDNGQYLAVTGVVTAPSAMSVPAVLGSVLHDLADLASTERDALGARSDLLERWVTEHPGLRLDAQDFLPEAAERAVAAPPEAARRHLPWQVDRAYAHRLLADARRVREEQDAGHVSHDALGRDPRWIAYDRFIDLYGYPLAGRGLAQYQTFKVLLAEVAASDS